MPLLGCISVVYMVSSLHEFQVSFIISRQKVAVLIPFKDRDAHLKTLLYHLHPMLMRQQIQYCIYVAEQVRVIALYIYSMHIRCGTVIDVVVG